MTSPSAQSHKTPRTPCMYCGANPVSHTLASIDQLLSGLIAPMNRFGSSRGAQVIIGIVEKNLAPIGIEVGKLLGAITIIDTPDEKTKGRGLVLWEEAKNRGITMEGVRIFGKDVDLYRVRVGKKKFSFHSLPQMRDGASSWWIDDKAILKSKLETAGIPVPRGGSTKTEQDIRKLFSKLQKPVIIKPRQGSRGRHTTTFIYTIEDAIKAFHIAKQLCRHVIMEEHLIGSVYRGTLVDGKLVGVLGGDPPRITGNGKDTILELITKKNVSKNKKVKNVVVTPHMEEFLARNNYVLTTILPTGTTIDLTEKIGVNYGGSSAEVTMITHPKIKTMLEKAGALIDHPIIGFDFIIKDITQDPDTQHWGIIECNSMPFINLHYDPVDGGTNPVAKDVWDYVLRTLNA